MNTIHLIRHAESQANAGMVTNKHSDILLTELGEYQAKEFSENYGFFPNLIVVSPYIRAKQTAKFVIDKNPSSIIEEWGVHEFTYLDSDKCIGTTSSIRKQLSDEYWEIGDSKLKHNGAESFEEFYNRAITFKQKIKEASKVHNKISVFTHKQVVNLCQFIDKNSIDSLSGDVMREFRQFVHDNEVKNCSVTLGDFLLK